MARRDARRLRLLGEGPAIHHAHRSDCATSSPLANFLASGVLALGANSGRCCGSFRRTCDTTPNVVEASLACCRAPPARRSPGSRRATTGCRASEYLQIDADRPLPARQSSRDRATFDTRRSPSNSRAHGVAAVLGDNGAGGRGSIEQPIDVSFGTERTTITPEIQIGVTQAIQIAPGQGAQPAAPRRHQLLVATPVLRTRSEGADHGGPERFHCGERRHLGHLRQPSVGRRTDADIGGDCFHRDDGWVGAHLDRFDVPRRGGTIVGKSPALA